PQQPVQQSASPLSCEQLFSQIQSRFEQQRNAVPLQTHAPQPHFPAPTFGHDAPFLQAPTLVAFRPPTRLASRAETTQSRVPTPAFPPAPPFAPPFVQPQQPQRGPGINGNYMDNVRRPRCSVPSQLQAHDVPYAQITSSYTDDLRD